jgi:hypothetical protein
VRACAYSRTAYCSYISTAIARVEHERRGDACVGAAVLAGALAERARSVGAQRAALESVEAAERDGGGDRHSSHAARVSVRIGLRDADRISGAVAVAHAAAAHVDTVVGVVRHDERRRAQDDGVGDVVVGR